MPAGSPRAEAVAQAGRGHRPRKRQRDRRRRRSEGGEGRTTCDAVLPQVGPGLEATQCGIDVPPEDPVERTGWKAVLGELELERRDVPTGLPHPELPAAGPMAAE